MMNKRVSALCGSLILCAATTTFAESDATEKGAKEIALESMLIVGHQSQDDASATQVAALAGLSFRYFLGERLSVGVSGGGFYRNSGTDDSDTGGMVRLIGSFHLPLATRFYIAPTVGVGGLFGSRRRSVGTDMILSRSLAGATFSAALPFVLYTGSRFDVRAGPEVLASVGSVAAPEGGGEADGFVNVDAGFSVGISWTF